MILRTKSLPPIVIIPISSVSCTENKREASNKTCVHCSHCPMQSLKRRKSELNRTDAKILDVEIGYRVTQAKKKGQTARASFFRRTMHSKRAGGKKIK